MAVQYGTNVTNGGTRDAYAMLFENETLYPLTENYTGSRVNDALQEVGTYRGRE